jgi:hypothetical protein
MTMPRFIVCAAIPLFDRGPINPAVPINRLRAPRVAAARASSGRRYRVPLALRPQARRHLSVFGTALRLLLE